MMKEYVSIDVTFWKMTSLIAQLSPRHTSWSAHVGRSYLTCKLPENSLSTIIPFLFVYCMFSRFHHIEPPTAIPSLFLCRVRPIPILHNGFHSRFSNSHSPLPPGLAFADIMLTQKALGFFISS